ncbi:MAG TPA: DUF1641 domain-containing protein [Polyangiales bacterium]|nr:DUF1641 domain-containing protein [Polyangiales bacterium]
MDPKVDPPTGSTTPGETRSDLEATLRRVEARLERLEQAIEPIVKATTAAPAFTSTAVDVIDEWANQHGDLDARLRTLSDVVERLTRPEALAPLLAFVELTEQAQPAFATITDIVDETMARAAADGMEIERLVESTKNAILRLAHLATAREVQALLDSGMLDPAALSTLGLTARAVADASDQPAPRVGMLAAFRATRQPSVQRALGFLLKVAENLGESLGSDETRLLLKSNGAPEPARNP